MKIAIIIPYLRQGGGAEKITSWLSFQLEKVGWEIHLITFGEQLGEHQAAGKRHILNENYKPGLSAMFSNALKINQICRQYQLTKVLSFTEGANLFCSLAKFLGGNFVLYLAVRNNPEFRGIFSRIFIRIFYRQAELVIANSEELQQILRNSFKLSNVTTIPNPVNFEENLRLAEEKISDDLLERMKGQKVFISIGRLIEQKGYPYLIRAFNELLKEDKNCLLIILGQGMQAKELKDLVKSFGLQEKILFLGLVKNVYPYLKTADCFILSSLYEGFPNVLLDALSLNKSIISTDCPTGPREILEAPLNDRLVYPYFAKYGVLTDHLSLENTMKQAIKENFWKDKYDRGEERVRQFDPTRILADWQKILN